MVTTYTTAPACYDYGWTKEIAVGEYTIIKQPDKIIRRVETPAEYVDGQRMRYGSGLHLAASQEDVERMSPWYLVPKEQP